jgi:DNA-binding response OmpR family regulator
LLILDIDGVANGGAEAVRIVRETSELPIIALCASSAEDVMIEAPERGADDYIKKPFSVREVVARANNAVRRGARRQERPVTLTGGELEIDRHHRLVRVRGRVVHLGAKPY